MSAVGVQGVDFILKLQNENLPLLNTFNFSFDLVEVLEIKAGDAFQLPLRHIEDGYREFPGLMELVGCSYGKRRGG